MFYPQYLNIYFIIKALGLNRQTGVFKMDYTIKYFWLHNHLHFWNYLFKKTFDKKKI